MMPITTEVEVVLALLSFIAFLMFVSSLPGTPKEYQIINTFDFAWFSAGILGVAGACVISTGIPCASSLVIFGLTSVFNYLIVNYNLVKLLIFTPIIATLIYIVARLGRGGG
jgi:hypothetical protein